MELPPLLDALHDTTRRVVVAVYPSCRIAKRVVLAESNGEKEACLVDFGVSAALPLYGLRKDSASSIYAER